MRIVKEGDPIMSRRMAHLEAIMRIGGGFCLLCLVVSAMLVYARAQQRPTRFTAAELVDRSLPLCRAIAGDTPTLRLKAEASLHLKEVWLSVQCTDLNGRDIATLYWNADTGRL